MAPTRITSKIVKVTPTDDLFSSWVIAEGTEIRHLVPILRLYSDAPTARTRRVSICELYSPLDNLYQKV